MKQSMRIRSITGLLALGLMMSVTSHGVSLSTLYLFRPTGGTYLQGSLPIGRLTQGTDGNFYGVTQQGGAYDYGTVFKMTPGGTVTSLYSFTGGDDGCYPAAGLVQGTDGNFYGTTDQGGAHYGGTIFRITPAGALTTLVSFNNGGPGAQSPEAEMIRGTDGDLYGTTENVTGPGIGGGTVYKLTVGGAFALLHSFAAPYGSSYVSPEGSQVVAPLVLGPDGNFYGTALKGGSAPQDELVLGYGTIFKITPGGSFSVLYSFTGGIDSGSAAQDGAGPAAALVLGPDGNFYGTTVNGGSHVDSDGVGCGTIFKITPGGVLTTLYRFTGGSDGRHPRAPLVLGSDGHFYGTTSTGGAHQEGTLFRITLAGTLTTLYAGADGSFGSTPNNGMIKGVDGNLYGTTLFDLYGWGGGSVFRLSGFSAPTYPVLTVQASPSAGGTVSGGGMYVAGVNVQISATPTVGWNFIGWNDGNTNAIRTLVMPANNVTYTANFQRTLGSALDNPAFAWSTGGSANWTVQTTTTHDGIAAARSGVISHGQETWLQSTTNGPGSLLFWWKASSEPNDYLEFYAYTDTETQAVARISGNANWQQYVAFLSKTNTYTLKWRYVKNGSLSSGTDAGWVDEVTWIPCPYAKNVPQLFFQNSAGLLASWILNSTGGFEFARILANTGTWALKAAGDIDGDGVSDLLFQTPASDTGGWFMNADGSYRDARFWWNTAGWVIKACADFEGVGRAQLFFQTSSGLVAYWRLDTNGVFQSAVVLGNMGSWQLRGGGDIDGDGKAELFWQNAAGSVAVWYHNPDGTIRGVIPFNTSVWALRGVTDVDADGVSDLLWQTPDLRTGGWFMNADGSYRDARFWWPTTGWQLKTAGR